MASNWKLIVPEGGTNLTPNPSFEKGTTGWATGGTNTIAQSSEQAAWGAYSLKATFQDSTILAQHAITLTAEQHVFSAWVYLPSNWDGGNILLKARNFAGLTEDVASTTTATTGEWVRLRVTITPDAGDLSGNLNIESDSAPTAGRAIYVDGVQCEAKGYITTYMDGDQKDCSWKGAQHGSQTERVAYGVGGRVRDFEDDLDFAALEMQDVGMPPVSLHFNAQAIRDTLASLRYERRAIRFTADIIGTSLSDLHDKRQALIQALLADTGRANDAPRLRRLRYTGATVDKEVDVTYDTGLELSNKNGFTDEAQVRFIAPDPFFYEKRDSGAVLDTADTMTVRLITALVGDTWTNLGPPDAAGTYTVVRALAVDEENGYLYIAGNFLNWDNIAAADRIVRYDIGAGTFTNLGSGGGSDEIFALAVAANGDLYATGSFGSMGGVANTTRIARWDGSSWNALSTGLNGTGRALAIGKDGRVWVGGDFTTAGGTTVNHITYWNGSAFVAVGSGPGLNNNVHVVRMIPALGDDEHVYIGGEFTAQSGGTAGDYNRFILITGAHGTPAFAAKTGVPGFDGIVRAIARVASGRVWLGGDFTQDDDANTLRALAEWTGSGAPTEVGGGIQNSGGTARVRAIEPAPDGTVWVSGTFDTAGSTDNLDSIVKRTGDEWIPPRIQLQLGATSNVNAIAFFRDDVYVGHNQEGSIDVAGSTDIAYAGTAPSYPVIKIARSGGTAAYLYTVKNITTGASLDFGGYAIQDGETVIIDTRPGHRSVANNKGTNLIGELSPASALGSFALAPGNSGSRTNTIEIFVLEDTSPTMTATCRYRTAYISVD